MINLRPLHPDNLWPTGGTCWRSLPRNSSGLKISWRWPVRQWGLRSRRRTSSPS